MRSLVVIAIATAALVSGPAMARNLSGQGLSGAAPPLSSTLESPPLRSAIENPRSGLSPTPLDSTSSDIQAGGRTGRTAPAEIERAIGERPLGVPVNPAQPSLAR